MKVLKQGRPQKGWARKYSCTGNGNGGGGCGAKLLVERGDLFRTSRSSMGRDIDYFLTFRCVECGVNTDIPEKSWPPFVNELPDYSTWLAAQRKEPER